MPLHEKIMAEQNSLTQFLSGTGGKKKSASKGKSQGSAKNMGKSVTRKPSTDPGIKVHGKVVISTGHNTNGGFVNILMGSGTSYCGHRSRATGTPIPMKTT